jgi:hypothetical protein
MPSWQIRRRDLSVNCTVFQRHKLLSRPAWTAQRKFSFPVPCTCHQLQCSCYLVNTDSHKISKFQCTCIILKERDYLFSFLWLCSPARAMASSSTRFRDHTQRRATVGRTLWTSDQFVTETSTWQHTQNRQTSLPPVGFEPTIAGGGRS